MTPVRSVTDDDWPAIRAVADASAPWKVSRNAAWLRHRRRRQADRIRRQHVATDDSGRVIGYGAIEESEPAMFRIFLVADPLRLPEVGPRLWAALRADLVACGAREVWMREEDGDRELCAFALERGLVETARYAHGELHIVELGGRWPLRDTARSAG